MNKINEILEVFKKEEAQVLEDIKRLNKLKLLTNKTKKLLKNQEKLRDRIKYKISLLENKINKL